MEIIFTEKERRTLLQNHGISIGDGTEVKKDGTEYTIQKHNGTKHAGVLFNTADGFWAVWYVDTTTNDLKIFDRERNPLMRLRQAWATACGAVGIEP